MVIAPEKKRVKKGKEERKRKKRELNSRWLSWNVASEYIPVNFCPYVLCGHVTLVAKQRCFPTCHFIYPG